MPDRPKTTTSLDTPVEPWVDPADYDAAVADAGRTLRGARMARGERVEDVAVQLRIRRAHLTSIEEGRTDQLPGHTYTFGFVRSYADYLGLDGTAMVEELKRRAGSQQHVQLVFPVPATERRLPGGAVMFLAVILAIGLYSSWYYISAKDRQFVNQMPPVPPRLAHLVKSGADSNITPDQAGAAPALPEDRITIAPPGGSPEGGGTMPPGGAHAGEAQLQTGKLVAGLSRPTDAFARALAQPTVALPHGGSFRSQAIGTQSLGQPQSSGQQAPQNPSPQNPSTALPEAPQALQASFGPGQEGPGHEVPGVNKSGTVPALSGSGLAGDGLEKALNDAELGEEGVAEEADGLPPTPMLRPQKLGERRLPVLPDLGSDHGDSRLPNSAQVAGNNGASLPVPPGRTLAADHLAPGARTSGQWPSLTGGNQIVIRALADSYIQVTDINRQAITARSLRAGETYRVPSLNGLRLTTGNAGGLELLVDGQIVPPLGRRNQIVRDAPLDASRLKAGTAVN